MNGRSGRGSCSYVHDVSGARFEDVDGERWTCPFEPECPDGRCLFHAPATTVDGTDVVSELLEVLDGAGGPVRLLGATLPSLPLEYAVLDGAWNYPIDLRDATIEGAFTARNATIRHPLRFEGARFEGPIDLEDATVTQAIRFDDVTATEPVSWYLTTFESWVDVRRATFDAPLDARVATFHQGIFAVEATFDAAAEFHSTQFRETANFHGATFRSGGMFDSAKFSGSARFSGAVLDAPVVKLASAAGDPNTTGETRTGTALTLEDARCERGIKLDEATLDGNVAFRNASLQRSVRTDGITVTDGTTAVVDCTGSDRITGRVAAADGRVAYDLTDAVVGTIDLVEGGPSARYVSGTPGSTDSISANIRANSRPPAGVFTGRKTRSIRPISRTYISTPKTGRKRSVKLGSRRSSSSLKCDIDEPDIST